MARDRRRQASPVQDHEFLRSLYGPAIYFVLREPLRRGQFDQVCAALEAHSDDSYGEQQGTHWERLQDRLTGLQPRWGTMVPAFDGPLQTPEDWIQFRAAWHAVPNLVSKRGYRAYRMDGLACTLDYFNPANELRVPYAGAGELVLALVLHSNRMLSGSDDRDIAHNLYTADELFAALQVKPGVRQRFGGGGIMASRKFKMRNEFTAIVERDGKWFVAYCPEVPGANGQGMTKPAAIKSLSAAIALILEDRREDGLRGLPKGAMQEMVTVG